MKTIFVTGATGFIGYHLCNRLFQEGHRIIACGRKGENKIKCHEFYPKKIIWEDIPKIDLCFHLAANNDTLNNNNQEMMSSNFYFAAHVFKNLLNKDCANFVYASSCSVYGNQPNPFIEDKTQIDPLNAYASSKVKFEEFTSEFSKRNRVSCIGLRYTNVYGTHEHHKNKRSSMIHQIVNSISRGLKPKIFHDGLQIRDWVYIDDVIDANMLAASHNKSDIFNIGSGHTVTFKMLVGIINKCLNKNIDIEYVKCYFQDKYQNNTTVSLEKSKKNLGYNPKFKIDEGIQDMKSKLQRIIG